MSVETIGVALGVRLETITGLRVYNPAELPKSVKEFPCALIMPGTISYHDTHGGASYYTITYRVIIAVTNQDQPSRLNELLDYIEPSGTYSVVAAIEGDRTLGATASDCMVFSNAGVGNTIWGGATLLSTEFEVRVLA